MKPLITRRTLAQAGHPSQAPPVRIVHLGLGAFHRAHQAWFTAHAADADDWGIAAFTGRAPHAAEILQAQDGLYTLIVRDRSGDRTEVVPSIVEANDGADVRRLRTLLARPEVAVVTLTVTERGYGLRWDGSLDPEDAALRADLRALRRREPRLVTTVLGRLLSGLDARRSAHAGSIAIVPCDNVPSNGRFLERGVTEAAARVGSDLEAWVRASVSFVSSSVDRITPRLDRDLVAEALDDAPWTDRAPVITEPYADWVLSGAFPAGRPRWEAAGARIVDDVEPWERRKLWMLNGAHTLLALAGGVRGIRTVADAVDDPELSALVGELWEDCARHLPSEVEADAYADRLRARFRNPRIEHLLAQIAQDSTGKLRLRIVPVAEAELAAGRVSRASAHAIGAWLASRGRRDDVAQEVATLSTELARSGAFVSAVAEALARMSSPRPSATLAIG